MKEYFCHKWPFYQIGKVKFEEGWFRTEDPALQAIVESNDMFGVYVWDASGEAHAPKEIKSQTEAGADSAALREVSHDDQKGRIRLPALQQDPTGQTPWAGAGVGGGSGQQGRETSPVFQELEELIRGSGIIGGEGKQDQPRSGKGSERSASGSVGANQERSLPVESGK